MISLLTDNQSAISRLCQRFGIRKLEVFGSAATGAFDPVSSDVDFVVDLGEYEPGVSDRYFDFADALEALLKRKVDLLTPPMIKNPYFRQAVDEQRVSLYEARDRKTAA